MLISKNMSRCRGYSVAVLAMLILQVLALVAQTPSIGGDNPKSSIGYSVDLEHHHHFDSAVSLEATQGEDGRIEVTVSANMDSELSLEIRSPDILDMPLNRISQHELSSGDHLSFNITKYPFNGEVNIIIVAKATTREGYSFREQMTITENTLLPDDECHFEMTLTEAITEGCAESTIRPNTASSKTGTSSYVTGEGALLLLPIGVVIGILFLQIIRKKDEPEEDSILEEELLEDQWAD
mgnify:CR=1 FL=1